MLKLRRGPHFPLGDAPSHILLIRAGAEIHPSTVYRWAKTGLRGVKLETIRIGGRLCTSMEALQRFCERLSVDETAATDPPSRASRRRAAGRATRTLDELGF